MRWTGIIVGLFLIFHLVDLTWGTANPDFVRGDVVRQRVRTASSACPVAIVYIVANLALAIHIFHGAWTMFQSLGLNNPRFNAWRRYVRRSASRSSSAIGNVSIPLLVVTGVVTDERDHARRARSPTGRSREKWDNHKFDVKLVNPANKRKFEVLVVGTGLAGASAAATLGELGYQVKLLTFHDSPRRAHSIAAQGGINAAKNYRNDGDSVHRLFYDTVKGGDYRAREANVYRLAQVSVNIIDQCVAQGVPVRPRVRRPARQPLVRRRAGVAARSTPAARPASSCCSARTRRWRARCTSATSSCTPAPRCSTSS